MRSPPKMPQRAMVRIWVASLHQELRYPMGTGVSVLAVLKKGMQGWIRTAAALSQKTAQKQPSGLFLAARLAQSTRAHQELQYPNRVLEFRNVYRDSCTCRNKVSRAWCSWMRKKLFVSENKSAPGCSSLEEELSGGCYWMHFIFAGAFSSGHCSRMFPAFCPGPDTRRGCRRSVWLCRGRAFRSRPAGSRPHHRR